MDINTLVVKNQQEAGEKQYFNRNGLVHYLHGFATDDEYPEIVKFIDESTAKWSRHLALNTHKKQTEQTPRFSLEEGPGILTVLLDRSDLDKGERAPQLQMIFARDSKSWISITQRIAGCMATFRMIDTFDQINRELLAGDTVIFTSAEQIVAYVESVAEHQSTAICFRQELGDPKSALLQSGVPPETRVTFSAEKKGDQIEVRTLVEDEDDHIDNTINIIMLDNVAGEGRIKLEISAKTRFSSAQAQAQELHQSAQFADVWEDVRETPATSDANIAAAEEALVASKSTQVEPAPLPSVAEESVYHVGAYPAISSKSHLKVEGNDEELLTFVINRLLNSKLDQKDRRALLGFQKFVIDGDGLANVDSWGYHGMVVRDGGVSLSQNFLRPGNNFFIALYDRTVKVTETQLAALAIFQCKINDE